MKPYGDVQYADPGHQADGKQRYPVDSPEHVKAAWSYINQADNAGKYSAEQLASVKAAIRKAAAKFGIELSGNDSPGPRSSTLDLCVRSYAFEWDERAKGDGRTLEGYAAVFNSPTRIRDIGGDFDELIHPGAFARSIRTRMPILQWDHGKDPRVGTVPIGAIQDLAEDSKGLHVRGRLFDNAVVEPVRQAIEARAVRGMSFRFGVPAKGDTWTRRSGDVDLRGIRDADVHELGPVAFPAYDDTSVSVRSILAGLDPDERRSLARELAAELAQLGLRVADLTDLDGRDGTRSAPGVCTGAEPDAAPKPHLRQRLDDGALRARGILL
jgi:HK97 family phage prohead protease